MPITPNFPGAVGEPTVLIIEDYAFASNSTITTANYSMCVHIKDYAFASCTSLTEANFPACTNISNNAFYDCTSLSSISFPACTTIGSYAFASCTSLTEASFPACTTIGSYAFASCTSLESFYLMGSNVLTLGSSVFIYTPMNNSSYLGYFGSIYVPSSLVDNYKMATNWSAYSNRIVGV